MHGAVVSCVSGIKQAHDEASLLHGLYVVQALSDLPNFGDAFKLQLVVEGVIEAALERVYAFGCSTPVCQAALAATLWGLACGHPSNKRSIVARGALPFLLQLLRDFDGSKSRYNAAKFAALSVWSVCYSIPENQEEAVNQGALPALLGLIACPEAIRSLAAVPAKSRLLSAGAPAVPQLSGISEGTLGSSSDDPIARADQADGTDFVTRAEMADLRYAATDWQRNQKEILIGQPVVKQELMSHCSSDPLAVSTAGVPDATDSNAASEAAQSSGSDDAEVNEVSAPASEGDDVAEKHMRALQDGQLMACLTVGHLSLASYTLDIETMDLLHSTGCLSLVEEFVLKQNAETFEIRLLWTTVKPLIDLLSSSFLPVQGLACLLICAVARDARNKSKLYLEGAIARLQLLEGSLGASAASMSAQSYMQQHLRRTCHTALNLLVEKHTSVLNPAPRGERLGEEQVQRGGEAQSGGRSSSRLMQWLTTLGLESYLECLEQREVTWQNVMWLTDEDLENQLARARLPATVVHLPSLSCVVAHIACEKRVVQRVVLFHQNVLLFHYASVWTFRSPSRTASWVPHLALIQLSLIALFGICEKRSRDGLVPPAARQLLRPPCSWKAELQAGKVPNTWLDAYRDT
ncbi:hypothetical protein CYMTET_6914 [Cymbomonas tetramitiformis]|uniref:SAM domain-containing protein n=1 Tax=Cymbomonas tetramitiformis TaxID=36881 RepID=A0AAE0LHJ3_9CHLO|nr:hypothetical protein CYMTET_6914 [Cymbomonas tetramitiformis]